MCARQGGTSQGPLDQTLLCAPWLKKVQQTFIYQIYAFLAPCALPSCPLYPQTTPPSSP